jgi:hypothetical protein
MHIFSILSTVFVIFSLARYLYQHRYVAIVNPLFWVVVLFLFYFQVPSIFAYEINHYFSWNISSYSIEISWLISSSMAIFFSLCLLVIKITQPIALKANNPYFCARSIAIIWWGISLYLISILLYRGITDGLSMTTNYTGEAGDVFKIKNVAYLLLPVSIFLFFSKRSLLVFLPNIIVVILDVLSGSRTTALIAVVPIAVSLCIMYRRLYVVPISIMVCGLILIGIVRSDNVTQDVPWYLNAMGEFRETYITLPMFISNQDYVGRGDAYTMLASAMIALLQPIRGEILSSIVLPGHFIYGWVGRGYGLGANIITEVIYYGYAFLLIIPPALFSLCMYINYLIRHSSLPQIAIHTSLFIIFFRLIFREGIFINVGLYLFVFAVYVFPIIMINRVRVSE